MLTRSSTWKAIKVETVCNLINLLKSFCYLLPHCKVQSEGAYLYDAVMIYARAATELLAEGCDPRNGTAIMEKIYNRSYHSIQGFDVRNF